MIALTLIPGTDAFGHCWRIWVALGDNFESHRRFWDETEPATITMPSGEKLPFAFGFDAELWHLGDVLRLIHLDPAAEAMAVRDFQAHGLTYDRHQISRFLGTEDAHLNDYLRESARETTSRLTLFDIDPAHWGRLDHTASDKTAYSYVSIASLVAALKAKNIPVSAKWEEHSGQSTQGLLGSGSALELIMDGSISEPKKFADLIHKFLHAHTESPETHYHVSIPVNAITGRQMALAARALEMKITLEETLLQLEYDGTLSPYDFSTLAYDVPREGYSAIEMKRGVVRVKPSRWKSPVLAHDVEIRQWLDADHALESMRFMMELAKNASRLRDTSAFTADRLENVAPANLPSSLEYAAFLLKGRLPEEKKHVPEALTGFANKIRANGKVSTAARDEVAAFIKQEDLLKYITLETFLEQEK